MSSVESRVTPPQWMTDGNDLTDDASRARRFASKQQAAEYHRTWDSIWRDQCFVSGHKFVEAPGPSKAEPTSPYQAWEIIKLWVAHYIWEQETFSRYRDDVSLDGIMTAADMRALAERFKIEAVEPVMPSWGGGTRTQGSADNG